ncbi:hypothetical protein PCG10_010456 [Penicillium crustosum]|uniref:Uncharacterized protein n=1 Tax=Penicillium crustosum TaxID=36656 RepID=A0A9P5GCB6_PENCR|nr:uncharacterized protein N7487_009262 [Penicillium crustosum]KAF7518955.1 hypothetical protein PCG10_010456 [Penicillium crustosum]KAJ5394959.1 hypothetical protein N7487_009262 [Penicillium crustosum]
MIQVPESQILVHIAAASTAQDDARYRAQVAAILDFQCASRHPLMEETNSSPPTSADNTHPFSADAAVQFSASPTTQHEASPILREAPRPAYTTLSSDPRLLPRKDSPAPRKHIISNHPDSLESLISVIPDSQPEIDQELVRAEQSRAELSPPSQLAPPPKRHRTAPASPDPAQPILIADSPATDQPATSHGVIPIENELSIPTSIPTGFPEIPIEVSSSDQGKGPDPPITRTTTPSHHMPANTPTPTPTQNQTPNHINLSTLPLEIHPPRPPISTAPFITHITSTLAMLTERLNPARTYKPSTQTRPLDPLERGYWLVHLAIQNPQSRERDSDDLADQNPNPKSGTTNATQSPTSRPKSKSKSEPTEIMRVWPYPLFHAFWSFLSDFVGRDGRAGWGVWCILEAATAPSTLSSDTYVSLKVYAWGEVAMHVYLLLFLASERRIRGMGVQWRDSGEEVVIQMP